MGELYRDPNQIPGKSGSSVLADTHSLHEVLELHLSYVSDQPAMHLRVRTADDREVLIQLTGLRQIGLDRLTPRLWLTEVEIEDVRADQQEGIRFRVFSRYDHSFDCLCQDFTIIDVQPV